MLHPALPLTKSKNLRAAFLLEVGGIIGGKSKGGSGGDEKGGKKGGRNLFFLNFPTDHRVAQHFAVYVAQQNHSHIPRSPFDYYHLAPPTAVAIVAESVAESVAQPVATVAKLVSSVAQRHATRQQRPSTAERRHAIP